MQVCVAFLVWSKDPAVTLVKSPLLIESHDSSAEATALIAGMWGFQGKKKSKL